MVLRVRPSSEIVLVPRVISQRQLRHHKIHKYFDSQKKPRQGERKCHLSRQFPSSRRVAYKGLHIVYSFTRAYVYRSSKSTIDLSKLISPVFRSALNESSVSSLDHLGDVTERPKVNVVRRNRQVFIHTRAVINATIGKVLRIDRH